MIFFLHSVRKCAKIESQRAVLITFVTLSEPLFVLMRRGSAVFAVGDLIVYSETGVCRVEQVGPPPFDPKTKREYYEEWFITDYDCYVDGL